MSLCIIFPYPKIDRITDNKDFMLLENLKKLLLVAIQPDSIRILSI